MAKQMAQHLAKFAEIHDKPLDLFLEPGKFLVADCGHFLVQVNTIKVSCAAKHCIFG